MANNTDSQPLSPLEQVIWSERMQGASSLEIALKLFLYEAAVREHLKMIARKLRAEPQTRGSLSCRDRVGSAPGPTA